MPRSGRAVLRLLGRLRAARPWVWALSAFAAAVLLTAAVGAYTALTSRGVSYGAASLGELRNADAPAIGANTFLQREPDPAKVRRELETLRAAGIRIVRQEFNWAEIEPQAPGEFVDHAGRDTWAKYDYMVDTARGLGIEILARLDRPPAWSTPGFDPQTNPRVQAPPADPQDFAAFAARLAARYRGKIRYYQVWNEPNLLGEWGGRPPDPAQYLQMLRAVGRAIRAADPDAQIVLAGLAPTIETGPDNLSDLIFLRRLYELGAKGDFDVAASMSYGLFTGPRDLRIDPQRTNFPRAVLWREIMLEFGDAATPIWAAEYGWLSLPHDWQGEPGIWGSHSSADQAAWTVDGIRRAREQWPWMPTIVIWASRWPEDPNPRDPTPYFRLMDKDFTPRPHLTALQEAFGAGPRAGVGLHQETHAAIAYAGPWPRVPSDLASLTFHRETGVPGASVRFQFDGTDLTLLTRRGPAMGRLQARIDGQDALADALPRTAAGEAVVDLYAPDIQPLARIPIVTRLPPGPHELELTVLADPNPASAGGLVIVDGLLVGAARPTAHWLALGAVWAGVGALTLWAARASARLQRAVRRRSWDWMDGSVGPLRMGEVVLAALAAAYALLPGGDPTSVWTLARVLIVLALAVLAVARLRDAALVAAAAIPFVGVIGRTGLVDRPVGEILILAAAAAWLVRALWTSPPSPSDGPAEPRAPAAAASDVQRPFSRLFRRLHRALQLPRPRWLLGAAAFVLAGVLAAALADYPKYALRDLRTVILEPVAFFLVLGSVLRGRGDVRRLLAALAVGAALAALTALALIPFGAVVTDVFPPRLRGTFGSPNNLALMLERALPLALALALAARAVRRLPWLAALAVLGAVLILTWSRGAWLGAVAGLAVAAWPLCSRWSWKRRAAAAAGLLALGAAAALTAGPDRLGQLLRLGDSGAASRLAVWDAAWRMGLDNPVLGVGPDNFLTHYRAYMPPDAWREPNLSHPHNLILDAWLSTGLAGLAALAVVLVVFWTTWAAVRRRRGAPDPLAYGLAGAMTAALAHGLVDHAYFLPELAAAFWLLAAAAEALATAKTTTPSQPP